MASWLTFQLIGLLGPLEADGTKRLAVVGGASINQGTPSESRQSVA